MAAIYTSRKEMRKIGIKSLSTTRTVPGTVLYCTYAYHTVQYCRYCIRGSCSSITEDIPPFGPQWGADRRLWKLLPAGRAVHPIKMND
jgi:hypothetical protein